MAYAAKIIADSTSPAGVASRGSLQNESAEDSLRDIAVYAIITEP